MPLDNGVDRDISKAASKAGYGLKVFFLNCLLLMVPVIYHQLG
jgi:hypothetical protein